jgi:hypothetical protein
MQQTLGWALFPHFVTVSKRSGSDIAFSSSGTSSNTSAGMIPKLHENYMDHDMQAVWRPAAAVRMQDR